MVGLHVAEDGANLITQTHCTPKMPLQILQSPPDIAFSAIDEPVG